MASIHKRPRSPYYHAAWRTTDGRLILRSTKQSDRRKAMEFALSCERAEKLAGQGNLTETAARKIVQEILDRAATGDVLRNPSVEDWFKAWVEGKEVRRSPNTALAYRGIVDRFIESLGDRAKRPLESLSTSHVQGYVTKRGKANCAPKTLQCEHKVIRACLNQARREGLISNNPAEAVELPEMQSIERGTFTAAEMKLLVDSADGEWKTLILLAYYTGARLGDCCSLEWSSVDLTAGTLTYTDAKTHKKIVLPLHPDLHTHLESIATADKPQKHVMPGMVDRNNGGANGVSQQFKVVARKAGLDVQTVQGKGKRMVTKRSFHALRHSFTSALANAGVSPELRMKLTGHASESVHAGYTHHELATLRDAVKKLPSL